MMPRLKTPGCFLKADLIGAGKFMANRVREGGMN